MALFALVGAMLLLGVGWIMGVMSTNPTTTSSAKLPSPQVLVPATLTYQECIKIATLIESLPSWSTEQFTDDQWQRIVEVGAALQGLGEHDVENILIAYMLRVPPYDPSHDPRTKPVLLLRVMFEIPAENVSETSILPAGGFPYKMSKQSSVNPSAIPIAWLDGKPTLVANRIWEGVASSGAREGYQPHIEFVQMANNFKYRELRSLTGNSNWLMLYERLMVERSSGSTSDR